jgi:SAM-dependent methyltransferase
VTHFTEQSSDADSAAANRHAVRIEDQFSRQARGFAAAPELHNEAVLSLLVDAAAPRPGDRMIDFCCGPGTVVAAFAPHIAQAVGLDATQAMLNQGKALADKRGLTNIKWCRSSAYSAPYPAGSFNIVVSRFAFHHLEDPKAAFAEMIRLAEPSSARIVLCDAIAFDDVEKAKAFNVMERYRDPSTVEFRTLDYLKSLFIDHGLTNPAISYFQVPYLAHELANASFPVDDDRAGLITMIEQSVDNDRLGMNARRDESGVHIAFQAVILTAEIGANSN